jgi:hypothetical protein
MNNVVTTQITSTLSSKLNYRYYNFDNGTPMLRFADWVQSDATSASLQSGHAPVSSLSVSYVKQNGGAELDWRPTRQWNVGFGYGYERYDWNLADASATNENSAKLFADWKPNSWLTARTNVSFGERRADNYNYLQNVGLTQWSAGSGSLYSSAYRQFFLDDRDRTAAKFYLDVTLLPNVTVTPTVGYRLDQYHIDPSVQEGLMRNQSLTAGAEVTYVMSPTTNFLFSYMNERQGQLMNMHSEANAPFNPNNLFMTTVDDNVNTYMFQVNHTLIPQKLDIKTSFTVATAHDHQPWTNPGATIASVNQFPDVNTIWERLDVTGIYTFDQDFVRRLGWKGDVKAKVRYAWERNGVMNWQNDMMSPYMYSSAVTGVGYMTWMAYNNPNYNAQMISASFVATW